MVPSREDMLCSDGEGRKPRQDIFQLKTSTQVEAWSDRPGGQAK